MNDINVLIKIINELGGSATLDQIATAIANKFKILLIASHKQMIDDTLKSHKDLVRRNIVSNSWTVIEHEREFLSVGDDIYFDTNRDVMLQVFGQKASSGKAYFYIDNTNPNGNDRDAAWFPLINQKNGDWTNTLENNNTRLIETPNNPKKKKNRKLDDNVRYVFIPIEIDGKKKKKFIGVFKNIELRDDGSKVLELVDDVVEYVKKSPLMMVCNISYMKYYRGITDDDQIQGGGGKYPTQNKDGGEKYNFLAKEDGYTYGFVETNYTTKDNMGKAEFAKNILLENISPSAMKSDELNGVRVVFISKGPNNDKNVVVGWYDNATVFRKRKEDGQFGYNLKCKNEDAHLIDEEHRGFVYPKKNDDGSYNFGQQNISYPYRQGETTINLANRLNDYLDKIYDKNTGEFFFFFFFNPNFYYEPVNLKQWNLFENISGIGHREYFLATKEMKKGDYLLCHVGKQSSEYESGIYCVCKIISDPIILENHPGEYCNGKLSVETEVVSYDGTLLMSHDDFAKYCKQFRTVNKIKQEFNDELKEYFNLD